MSTAMVHKIKDLADKIKGILAIDVQKNHLTSELRRNKKIDIPFSTQLENYSLGQFFWFLVGVWVTPNSLHDVPGHSMRHQLYLSHCYALSRNLRFLNQGFTRFPWLFA